MSTSTSTIPAPSAADFCHLIAAARTHRLDGVLEGSAYCSHPVFVFRRNILLANAWTTSDACFAEVFSAHPVEFRPWCRDSLAHGDPYPHPVNGTATRVYAYGRWGPDGPWQQQIIEILDELRAEIAAAAEAARQERDKAAAEHAAASRAAIGELASLYGAAQ